MSRSVPYPLDATLEEIPVYAKYHGRCVICFENSVTLHECPPRSLNPDWQKQPENRYPVCNDCHVALHDLTVQDQRGWLRASAHRLLVVLG